jgi:hypothetical protein
VSVTSGGRLRSPTRGARTTRNLPGDNNDFVNLDHPTESELIGKLWVHVPKGGRVLGYFRLVRVLA